MAYKDILVVLDGTPAAAARVKLATSLLFRRTSIAPTDDSKITQHQNPTLKPDRLLV